MFSYGKGVVPQLVDQYNDLIDRNLCPNIQIINDFNDNQNESLEECIGFSDETSDKCLQTYNGFNDLQTLPTITIDEDNAKPEDNRCVSDCEPNQQLLDPVPNERIIEISDQIKSSDKVSKVDSKPEECFKSEKIESLRAIKVNPVLERLMIFRKHSFITKTIVCKEFCNICDKNIKFSEKYIQCVDCIAISHISCAQQIPVPCIRYTDPNLSLRPTKLLSNYVYPAFRPSVPALLVHCIREIEQRCHESTSNTLYVMNSEGLKSVKDLLNIIMKSKNGFPLLKNFNIHIICGVIKKFLSDFNESLIGCEIWKQFSYNMNKKCDEELESMLKQMICELNVTNRDTLSLLILHLKHLADNQKSIHLDVLSDIFCPIICGDTQVVRKLRLMSSLVKINYQFWINILNK